MWPGLPGRDRNTHRRVHPDRCRCVPDTPTVQASGRPPLQGLRCHCVVNCAPEPTNRGQGTAWGVPYNYYATRLCYTVVDMRWVPRPAGALQWHTTPAGTVREPGQGCLGGWPVNSRRRNASLGGSARAV